MELITMALEAAINLFFGFAVGVVLLTAAGNDFKLEGTKKDLKQIVDVVKEVIRRNT